METSNLLTIRALRPAWNKGRIVGHKLPLKPKHVWAIHMRLELTENHRDLALFNMAIDSKLRGCDLVQVKVVGVISFSSRVVPKTVAILVGERRSAKSKRATQEPSLLLIVGSVLRTDVGG